MGLVIPNDEQSRLPSQGGTKEVLITVRAEAPITPSQFHFDVWAENGKIKVAHSAADQRGHYVELKMDGSEVTIGCTTVTLEAFEIIRQAWEQYRKQLKKGRKS